MTIHSSCNLPDGLKRRVAGVPAFSSLCFRLGIVWRRLMTDLMQSGFQLIAKDHVVLQSFDNAVRMPTMNSSLDRYALQIAATPSVPRQLAENLCETAACVNCARMVPGLLLEVYNACEHDNQAA